MIFLWTVQHTGTWTTIDFLDSLGCHLMEVGRLEKALLEGGGISNNLTGSGRTITQRFEPGKWWAHSEPSPAPEESAS